MSVFLASTRARVLAALLLVAALVLTFPLSLAFRLVGLDRMGVAARSLRGPVWWGGAEELEIAGVRLGTVDVFLNPFQLLLGRARMGIARYTTSGDNLTGAVTIGLGTHGLDDVTGNVPLAAALAPLPISRAEFDRFSVRFSGDMCAKAEGRLRVRVPAMVSGLNLANGFSGEARCDGQALLLPLTSQSGQEKVEARIYADGRFEAVMRVRSGDPQLGLGLAASGFRPAPTGEQILRVSGQL